jgi:hypothetical protein
MTKEEIQNTASKMIRQPSMMKKSMAKENKLNASFNNSKKQSLSQPLINHAIN